MLHPSSHPAFVAAWPQDFLCLSIVYSSRPKHRWKHKPTSPATTSRSLWHIVIVLRKTTHNRRWTSTGLAKKSIACLKGSFLHQHLSIRHRLLKIRCTLHTSFSIEISNNEIDYSQKRHGAHVNGERSGQYVTCSWSLSKRNRIQHKIFSIMSNIRYSI